MPRPSPKKPRLTATAAALALAKHADRPRAVFLARFFRTGEGEYGEGDQFIGVTVPDTRRTARDYYTLPMRETLRLLHSPLHEERLLALLILERQYLRGDKPQRQVIFDTYLRNLRYVNNWDLVDVSCAKIVGGHLLNKSRRLLTELARSSNVWKRRIAIVSTFAFLREGETKDTFRIARLLLNDKEDLIHKATGWLLREAGKRDRKGLYRFLTKHAATMPRTTLRYAIERLPPDERKHFLAMKAARALRR